VVTFVVQALACLFARWRRDNNTHNLPRIKIRYFLHPLYRTEVSVVHERRLFSEKVYAIRLLDNSVTYLPGWMADPEVCDRCLLQNKPECSLAALLELRRLLGAAQI
jgi:hypothetical protein